MATAVGLALGRLSGDRSIGASVSFHWTYIRLRRWFRSIGLFLPRSLRPSLALDSILFLDQEDRLNVVKWTRLLLEMLSDTRFKKRPALLTAGTVAGEREKTHFAKWPEANQIGPDAFKELSLVIPRNLAEPALRSQKQQRTNRGFHPRWNIFAKQWFLASLERVRVFSIIFWWSSKISETNKSTAL